MQEVYPEASLEQYKNVQGDEKVELDLKVVEGVIQQEFLAAPALLSGIRTEENLESLVIDLRPMEIKAFILYINE